MYAFDWSSIPGSLLFLWEGFLRTLSITLVAGLVGLILGTALALARLSSSRFLSTAAAIYINSFRAVPLVMVLLWFYLLVPQLFASWTTVLGWDSRFISALVAFSLFEASYYAEIIRTGVQSVGSGQMAAGLALGLTPLETMQLIVLPQAFRRMIPLLLTQAIILFQDTSLVYVIGLADFFGIAYRTGQRDGTLVEMLLFVGAVYLLICSVASALIRTAKTRLTS
jgi:glutamate/aspartate transport system permease protein